MISAFPTDPHKLRAIAAAHEAAAVILRDLADDLALAAPRITITDCPASYEFRGDSITPPPLTPAEQAERDLARFREWKANAERESRG